MGLLSNQMRAGAAGAAGGGGGDFYSHQIANSCRFIGASGNDGTHYMKQVRGTPTNAKKCTISAWVKRSLLGSKNQMFTGGGIYGSNDSWFGFLTANTFRLHQGYQGSAPYVFPKLQSRALFRDPSAWMHIVLAFDSTQSTAADRNKVYFNGVQYTDWVTDTTNATLNYDWVVNTSGYTLFVGSGGASEGNSWYPFDGYIAEYVFIDGTQYAATDFAETVNGVWQPKDPSGLTFGNNGAYLKFESSGNLGNDSSGNNNDFAVTGVAAHDQMGDSPTSSATDGNGGNFMTYNGAYIGANNALAEGNLKSTGSAAGNNSGTFGMLTGKWYWECRAETVSAYGPTFGIGQSGRGNTDGEYDIITWQTQAGQMYGGGGYPVGMGTITVTSTGVTSLSSGDILSFWLDCDNRKLWIGKNGTIPNSGNVATGANPQASWSTTPTSRYFTATCQNVGSGVGVLNAGQNPSFNGAITAGTATDKNGFGLFKYDPSGTDFIACCAANIPISSQIDPAQTSSDYPQKLFSPLIWTGDGSTSRAITGLGFQPDWLWFKSRSSAFSNRLYDTTRGIASNGGKRLFTNTTGAEVDQTSGQDISAVGTDGFTMGASSNLYNNDTNSGGLNVGWLWRANGGTTVSNSTGSLSVTQQVDPSGSFSISTYNGDGGTDTIGHGLSSAPTMVIVKQRNGVNNWAVYAKGAGATKYAYLDTDAAFGTAAMWQNTAPSSSLVYLGDNNEVNAGGRTYVAYCFADTEGYCKSGSYYGNANTDGTFVYTGFKPSFMMCKPLVVGNWRIQDTKRSPFNVADKTLFPNHSNAEQSYYSDNIDILSNGFKMRASDSNYNQATTFVYLAMAENPFKYSLAR